MLPSRAANFKMRMINPDGSEAEMCGNGIRVFAKYAFDRNMHTDPVMTVETLGGIKTIKLDTDGRQGPHGACRYGRAQTAAVGNPHEGREYAGGQRSR